MVETVCDCMCVLPASQMSSSLTCVATLVSSPFWMLVPMPMSLAVSLAMFRWSPVIIFTRMPARMRFAMVCFVSCRGGSSIGMMPTNLKGPSLIFTETPRVL